MSSILSDSPVTVSKSRSEVTYTINDKDLLYKNGLKALQYNCKHGFVCCTKSNVNGAIKLKYGVSEYERLSHVMSSADQVAFLKITRSLLSTAIFLREDGTMQRENISINPDDIYVDKNFKTYLIYVPVNSKGAPNAHIEFEMNLRNILVTLANQYKSNKNLVSDFVIEICKCLMETGVSMQDIVNRIDTQEIKTKEMGNDKRRGTTKVFRDDIPAFVDVEPEKPKTENKIPESGADQIIKYTNSKTYDKSNIKKEKKEIVEKKEKSNNRTKVICFFSFYIVVVVAALFIVFNYYTNSGMTGGFVLTLVIFMVAIVLAPVIVLMKKNPPSPKKTYDTSLIEAEKENIGGFVSPIVLKNNGEAYKYEFFINKEKFVIGKAKELVDGFISFDKSVSDTHCAIEWNKKKFFIKDLDSEYGTYVNGVRVIPGQLFPLNNGDKVQICKYVFTVTQV